MKTINPNRLNYVLFSFRVAFMFWMGFNSDTELRLPTHIIKEFSAV